MNTKSLLPWIVTLILLAAVGLLLSSNQQQASELLRLQAEGGAKRHTGADDAGKTNAAGVTAEVVQLRKDHEELLRLRNEIRQAREENQQLTKQLQTAKQAAPDPQHQQELQNALAELQQIKTQNTATQQLNQAAVCANSLRLIDLAKQQWAAENNRPIGSVVGAPDLAAYFPNKTFPVCPGGGGYTISPIGQTPLCNIPGHALRK